MKLRVVTAFSNAIFSECVAKLIEGDDDMVIAGTIEHGADRTADSVAALKPSVIIADYTSLYNSLPSMDDKLRNVPVVLLDTNCGKENIVTAILDKKICGVLLSRTDAAQLKKAIRAVSNGEIWIDRTTVKNLINGINDIEKDRSELLSRREMEITGLIGQGFRNGEIALKLEISEHTVKTHLSRIFKKLEMKSRSELITYAIKNTDMLHKRILGVQARSRP